jgi:hypothetical protein
MYNNVNWRNVLTRTAGNISTRLDLDIVVENFILEEIEERVQISLNHMDIPSPNVAKVAGTIVFWVRKLKPFSYAQKETAKRKTLHALNELIAVQAGIATCEAYKDDYSKEGIRIEERLLIDWLHNLRFHSHSPHSSLFAFELLATQG